ncbi:7546_t:CDS:2, partial [Dentiscutata erythropus]
MPEVSHSLTSIHLILSPVRKSIEINRQLIVLGTFIPFTPNWLKNSMIL